MEYVCKFGVDIKKVEIFVTQWVNLGYFETKKI